jgi:hypothetical protein
MPQTAPGGQEPPDEEPLEAQAKRSPVPVSVQAGGISRYCPETEAAVYFSVLEALQNVAKYSGQPTRWSACTTMMAGSPSRSPTMWLASNRAPVPTGPVSKA